jgi:hypothetical protein
LQQSGRRRGAAKPSRDNTPNGNARNCNARMKRLSGNETLAMGEDTQMVERLKVLGSLPYKTTPDGFKARVVADIERWSALVNEAGVKRIGAQ